MPLLLSFLLLARYQADTVPNSEIYCAPYHCRLTEYKNGDSLTADQLFNAGPLICDNPAFEVIGFNWDEAGTCFGGHFLFGMQVKGNTFPAADKTIISSFWQGTILSIYAILV